MRWGRYLAAVGAMWWLYSASDRNLLLWTAALVLFVMIRQEEDRERRG